MDFYRGYEHFINFASGEEDNYFGARLLDVVADKFDNIEDAVYALTLGLQDLGFDADEDGVVGLMTGQILPSEEVLEAFLNDEGLVDNELDRQALEAAALLSYEVARAGADPGDEDEDEDDEDVDEAGMDTYEGEDDADEEGDEGYVGYEEIESRQPDPVTVELYNRQIISDVLNEYSSIADQMMEGGKGLMTPHIKQLLFGKSDKQRYMNFSAAVESSDMDAETYLQCINFSLDLLSELEGIDSLYFTAAADEDISDGVNFSQGDSKALETEARQMIEWLGIAPTPTTGSKDK